jgi:sialate O-acetylesterase
VKYQFLHFCLLFVFVKTGNSAVKISELFSDHMVIQQGVTLPVWGTADPGEQVIVSCAGQEGRTVTDGAGRWRMTLRPISFRGDRIDLIINASNRIEIHDVLPGDVWIAAGEGEMATPLWESPIGSQAAKISDPATRFYLRDAAGKGSWMVGTPETSPPLPAIPLFFARALRPSPLIPIGIIDCTSKSPAPISSWFSAQGLRGLAPQIKANDPGEARPSQSYNRLILPLIPMAITGVIWDQGSSDEGDRALRHRLFLSHLIRNWRRAWGQGPFPFLMTLPAGKGSSEQDCVEPYMGDHGIPHRAWPWIRDGISSIHLPNTGIASATDLGSEDDATIDPLIAGRRLALTARHLVYGEDVACTGPIFSKAHIEKNRLRISFEEVKGGLTVGAPPKSDDQPTFSVNSKLKGFAVRGKGGKWFPAEAQIDGETILLFSDAVPMPVDARYNWKSLPNGNLYDRAGLPAHPFRTDFDQPH